MSRLSFVNKNPLDDNTSNTLNGSPVSTNVLVKLVNGKNKGRMNVRNF
jgi:hypothetical protein